MTSLNNISAIGEAAGTAVLAGLGLSLVFSFCQYFNERRKKRAFRNSWKRTRPDGLSGSHTAMSSTAPSLWNWAALLWQGRATTHEPESSSSFTSYFIHHIGRYSFAIVSVTLVLIVRCLLDPALGERLPFSFFLAAVLFTARTQGIWETVLALVLGFLVGTWFIAQPGTLGISGTADWWAAGLYFTIGFGIIWLMKSEQTAWLRTLAGDLSALKWNREHLPAGNAHDHIQITRELLANIVECAQGGIFSITPEGRVMTWNAAAEKLFGWSPKDTLDLPLTRLLPPARTEELRQITEQMGRGTGPRRWETILNSKSGTGIQVCLSVSPVNDSLGRFIGVSMIVQDHSIKYASDSSDLAGGQ